AVFRVVSQTGIRYRRSALSQSLPPMPERAPRAGDRFPWLRLKLSLYGPVEDLFQKLDDLRLHLILIGQVAPSEASLASNVFLAVHVIPADPINDEELKRADLPSPSFYLLRPDGHVGLCGTRLEAREIERYLQQRLRLH